MSTHKGNISGSTAASTTMISKVSRNTENKITSATVEGILRDYKVDKLIKLETYVQYLDLIRSMPVKEYMKEAKSLLSLLIREFEGDKEYYLLWVRFLDVVYVHLRNKPLSEEEAFKRGIEEILAELLLKNLQTKNIDWRIARKILSLKNDFSIISDSDLKQVEEGVLRSVKSEIDISLDHLVWKEESLFVISSKTALISLRQCFNANSPTDQDQNQEQGQEDLLEAVLCGRFDKEKFKLQNSLIIGEDGGLYMLLNRMDQQQQDALVMEQVVTADYLKDKIKEKDGQKGDKVVLGTGGFGTVKFALSLLRSRSLPGEIVCVKKTRSFQKLGGNYKPTALEQIIESTLGDYFTNDRAQAIYSPCILDMALVTTKNVNKDDGRDHRKGYLMMEILPQNTATRIFADEKYQKWEYQKPYLLDVLENTQRLLESDIAMTDLKPDNTLYDIDTRKATIIDLGGSVKVAGSKDLFVFDMTKYSFQSTPEFRAPELGRSQGVVNIYKSLAYSCGKVIEAITLKSDYDQQAISRLIDKLTVSQPEERISLLEAITEIKGMGDDSYRKNIIFSHYINKVKDRLENKKSALTINEDIDKTRELFITLNSTSLDPSKYKNLPTEDLFKKIDDFFSPGNTRQVMAMFGVAGSGKSVALQLKFIEAVYAWEPGQPLPIFFNLANGIDLDQIIRTLNTELDTNLNFECLDGQHLYIDSFDEGLGIEHKRETLIKEYFRQLGSPKILITCRTDYLQASSEDWFSPESNELEMCYVTPINYNGHQDLPGMIEKYVIYSKQNSPVQQSTAQRTTQDYLERLKELQLTDLINTGFMFFLVMEVLFQLKDKKNGRVNKVDIYANYVNHYQKSQIAKIRNQDQKKRLTEMILSPKGNQQSDALCSFAAELGRYLACQMHLMNQARLGESDLEKLFTALGYDSSLLLKHQSIVHILKLLPLKIVTTHSGKRLISNQEVKIGFIHETLKNYYLIDAIKNEVEREGKSLILASKSIVPDGELVRLIALAMKDSPKLKASFLKTIEHSKHDKSIPSIIHASNSISLLVAAKHSFAGCDLSNIAVKGANIVNGTFTNANLDNSDLSGAEMSNVDLTGASLNGADMRGVNFSISRDLTGHNNAVSSVDFSPDGKFLASGSDDKTIKIWNPSSGECIYTLTGHASRVSSVCFSPDGKFLASGSQDKTIKIWDLSTRKCLQTLEGHDGYVNSVSFSPDGKFLASGSGGGEVKQQKSRQEDGKEDEEGQEDKKKHNINIWDLSTGKCLRTLEGHYDYVNSVSFSPDGKFLASGSGGREVKQQSRLEDQNKYNIIHIWNISTGECQQTLKGHTKEVFSVSFSPDGKFLASGSGDSTINFWNPSTGKCLQSFTGHTDPVFSVTFSPDGKSLASGSADQRVKIWNTSTGECLQTLNGHTDRVPSVIFSPDGKTLASGSGDKTIRAWNPNVGECLQVLSGHTNYVSCVGFSPDGKFIASGSVDRTIKIWNTSTGECMQTLNGHTKGVLSLIFSTSGKTLASGSSDNTIKVWNVNTGECLQTLNLKTGRMDCASISPNGQYFAIGSGDLITTFSPSTGKLVETLHPRMHGAVGALDFSPDGKVLASASLSEIQIWDPTFDAWYRIISGHSDDIRCISFSPTGKYLASGSQDHTIKIWNPETGRRLRTLKGHTNGVHSVCFSADGKFLASGSDDKTIKVWNPNTYECLHTLTGHTDRITSVSFSPDGKSIVSGSYDYTLKVFGFEAKSNTWHLKHNVTGALFPLLAVGASLKNARISEDNKFILIQKKADTTSSIIDETVNQTEHHADTSAECNRTVNHLSQVFLEKFIAHQQYQVLKLVTLCIKPDKIPVNKPDKIPVDIPKSSQPQQSQDSTFLTSIVKTRSKSTKSGS